MGTLAEILTDEVIEIETECVNKKHTNKMIFDEKCYKMLRRLTYYYENDMLDAGVYVELSNRVSILL